MDTQRSFYLLCALSLLTSCGDSARTTTAPSPTAQRCAVGVAATVTTIGASGGSGAVTVQTERECQWTATSDVSWLTFAGTASGQGPVTLQFSVAGNRSTVPRLGGIAVNEQRVAITQEAATCEAAVSPRALSLEAGGGAAQVVVTTQDFCPWTAVSSESWISVTSVTGTGSTEIVVSVGANPGSARSGVVAIAGQQVTVSQAPQSVPGCSFAIAPATASLSSAAESVTVTVIASAGCTWAASSTVSWIVVAAGASGSGNGAVSVQVAANTGAGRTGNVLIAGQVMRIDQSAATVPCTYSIAPTGQTLSSTGGGMTTTVTTGAGCRWTATSNASWLRITAGASGAGNGTVSLSADANTGAARVGTASIAGGTFTVSQEAATVPCDQQHCAHRSDAVEHRRRHDDDRDDGRRLHVDGDQQCLVAPHHRGCERRGEWHRQPQLGREHGCRAGRNRVNRGPDIHGVARGGLLCVLGHTDRPRTRQIGAGSKHHCHRGGLLHLDGIGHRRPRVVADNTIGRKRHRERLGGRPD